VAREDAVEDTHDRVLAVAGPRLAAAEQEVADVVRLRGATALTGGAATSDAVLRGLATAGTVHIAAHGRLRTDNPMLSSLEMADGPLTVYDLEQLPTVPAEVLLPACQSGSTRVRTGDEVMGLAQALLALGARSIVATVLAVPDTHTRSAMATLHERLAAGDRPAAALAAVRRAAAGSDDLGRRAAAAAFLCFGAG
jgi:CHAT domain-containing protein